MSFQVRAGEIVGLAGLVGSGRSEIARAIFGIDRGATGEVVWQGQPLAADPWTTLRRGVALVPEDRGAQGLLPGFSIARNLTLSSFDRIARHGFVSPAAETALAERFIESMRIKPPRRELPADALSGGNQQKVVIGRMLAVTPRLLLLDEPTQGIDVGAKAEIHALIDRLVNEGLGVLCISSDLPEVLGLPPIIITLATLAIYRGVAYGISAARAFPIPDSLSVLGQGYLGPLPVRLPLFLAVAAGVWLVLARTTFGRTLYALGVNETAARFAGLHVDRVKLAAYAASGLLSAAAAVIFISRVSSAKANAGEGYELDAITIVVLGGGSVAGGRGGVIGTLLGLAIIGVTRNGLTQAYIPPEVQAILIGAVLVAAVVGNELFARWWANRRAPSRVAPAPPQAAAGKA